MWRWWVLLWGVLLAGCATGTPVGLRSAAASPASKPPVAFREREALARAGGGGGPATLVARTVLGALPRVDAFEQLLRDAGLEERDALPVPGSPLTPQAAARLWAVLLRKPVTLGTFPPRMAVGHLLREVLEGGEVSREELLRRVERFARVAVLRPDGSLAWVLTGRTQQKAVGPLEWKDGTFRAGPLELGRFYVGDGMSFRLADARMRPAGSPLAEVYDDADVLGRSLDGAGEAFFELAMALGKTFTYPLDSLASLRHLPAGVAALIASSPAYFERFRYMTRGQQMQAVARLATTLLLTCESLAGTPRTLAGGLGGAEATVPVLSLSAEGAPVLELVAVPAGKVATAVGAGVGGVYVLSSSTGDGGSTSNTQGRAPSREQRLEELAKDHDRGGKVSAGTQREAEVALALEEQGKLPPPVRRPRWGDGHSGDFVDGAGRDWDVKCPHSRAQLIQDIEAEYAANGRQPPRFPPNKPIRGQFDVAEMVKQIKEEIKVGESVILDTSKLSPADLAALREAVKNAGLEAHVLFYP